MKVSRLSDCVGLFNAYCTRGARQDERMANPEAIEAGNGDLPIIHNDEFGIDTEFHVRMVDVCYAGHMSNLAYNLNGRKVKIYGCQPYVRDVFQYKRVGDTMIEILTQFGEGHEDVSGLTTVDGRQSWGAQSNFCEYWEVVSEYGYGHKVCNVIPNGKFIELLMRGDRFMDAEGKDRCGFLLWMIGEPPTLDPRDRAIQVFSKTNKLTQLLAQMAIKNGRPDSAQENIYNQYRLMKWNLRTKSTSTTF